MLLEESRAAASPELSVFNFEGNYNIIGWRLVLTKYLACPCLRLLMLLDFELGAFSVNVRTFPKTRLECEKKINVWQSIHYPTIHGIE